MKLMSYSGGYQIWLSADDTYKWAHKAGAAWPCSTLSGKRLRATIDTNGLCDFTLDGKYDSLDTDGEELAACIADHTINDVVAREFWPNWC